MLAFRLQLPNWHESALPDMSVSAFRILLVILQTMCNYVSWLHAFTLFTHRPKATRSRELQKENPDCLGYSGAFMDLGFSSVFVFLVQGLRACKAS